MECGEVCSACIDTTRETVDHVLQNRDINVRDYAVIRGPIKMDR